MPEPCLHYIVLIPPVFKLLFILYGPCKLKSSMYYFAPNRLVPPWFYMSWSFNTIYSLQCFGLSHFAFVFIASTNLCSISVQTSLPAGTSAQDVVFARPEVAETRVNPEVVETRLCLKISSQALLHIASCACQHLPKKQNL